MKTKLSAPLAACVVVGILFAAAAVSAMKIKEPSKSGCGLLIGRITMTCEGFPKGWNINGDHTKSITLSLRDSSNRTTTAVSRGGEGFFSFPDLDAGQYTLIGCDVELNSAGNRIHLGFDCEYPVPVEGDSVNNLGDIAWLTAYETRGDTEYTEARVTTTFYVRDYLAYKGNYDACKSWFAQTFPKSGWNTRGWVNIEMPETQ